MAGIKEAMKRVMDHRNEGVVIAKGKLQECLCGENEECSDCSKAKYIIIRLDGYNLVSEDGKKLCGSHGLITVYDYGSDIRISDDIEIMNEVMLMIRDNWTAEWVKKGDVAFPEGHIDKDV